MSWAVLRTGIEQLERAKAAKEARAAATAHYPDYRDDPVGFCTDVLGEDRTVERYLAGEVDWCNAPWSKQAEIMEAVRDHPRVVVPAAHSVGKTHMAARVGLWFLLTRRPAIVISTAPKATQVRDLLWSRLRAAHLDAAQPLPGRPQLTRYDPDPSDASWFAVGRTARDAHSFAGYHEAAILLLLDEGPGVPPHIWEAIEGILSTEGSRVLAIGNPVERTGPFYAATRSPMWHTIRVPAWDHPNVRYQRLMYKKAVAPAWPEERRLEWGEDSPVYKSRVMGLEPDEAENTLIPLAWVEAAQERELAQKPRRQRTVAVDVARYGTDETVFLLLDGLKVSILTTYTGKPTTETAGRAVRLAGGLDQVVVDDAGVGGGVVDLIRQELRQWLQERRLKLLPFNAGTRATQPGDFANLGSEAMWNLREALRLAYEAERRGGNASQWGLSLPKDPVLTHQLSARRYIIDSAGRIVVEPKDAMRKRGEPSPDRADALAMAYWTRWRGPGVTAHSAKPRMARQPGPS